MLNKRMQAIIDMLGSNVSVADIGCDHGKISCYLAKNKLAKRVFATDISMPSLEKARKLAEKEKLENVSFLCGDGFNILPEPVDAAVIAGMGGDVIAQIIKNPIAKKCKLVLQPMKDSEILYNALNENGFCVKKVVVVCDAGRFYEIILASEGVDEASKYKFLPFDKLEKNKTAKEYIEHEIKVRTNAVESAVNTVNDAGKARCAELVAEIEKLNEVLNNAYGK